MADNNSDFDFGSKELFISFYVLKQDLFEYFIQEFNEEDSKECETDDDKEQRYIFSVTADIRKGYQSLLSFGKQMIRNEKDKIIKQLQATGENVDFLKKKKRLATRILMSKNEVGIFTIQYAYWWHKKII